MAENELPPHFHGIAVLTWKPNRRYRVYALPGALGFVWESSAGELRQALTVQGGLIGGLLARALADDSASRQRQEELDRQPLAEQLVNHRHNFLLRAETAGPVHLGPRSFWLGLGGTPEMQGHQAVIRFRPRLPGLGKMRLCLPTLEDARATLEHLPRSLGEAALIGLRWDEARGRFVKIR